MNRPTARESESVRPQDGLTRRDFLLAGSVPMLGLGLSRPEVARAAQRFAKERDLNCILLLLNGGPSQVDTWDPKPEAPESVRGPYRPIATRIPGVQVSELFPRLATILDRVSLVRTLHHDGPAIHDTGHQLLQTGRAFQEGVEHPHLGCVVSYLKGSRAGIPAHVLLPQPIGQTGGGRSHGQSAGFLGRPHDPFVPNGCPDSPGSSRLVREALELNGESVKALDRYGQTRFGRSCLQARRLIERGCRFVTVNQFETVFDEPTWDCHGSSPFCKLGDYRNLVAPSFDNAYASLIEDLSQTGLLETTMVLALGEFGRTPRLNASGGRDHHTACWTALVAGGPIQGGRVIGASDEIGHAPKDRPVKPAEIIATAFQGFGLSLDAKLPGPQGQPVRLVEPGVEPIWELL